MALAHCAATAECLNFSGLSPSLQDELKRILALMLYPRLLCSNKRLGEFPSLGAAKAITASCHWAWWGFAGERKAKMKQFIPGPIPVSLLSLV